MDKNIETIPSNLLEEITALATAKAVQMDAEIVDVFFSKNYNQVNLNITVFKKGGTDLNLLESLHNEISTALDDIEDKFPPRYTLNLSSPGLDRPIVTDDDFRRSLDLDIEVIYSNKTSEHGILKSYDSEFIEISQQNETKKIDRSKIAKAQQFVSF